MKLELAATLIALTEQLGSPTMHEEFYPLEWSWIVCNGEDARDSLILHLYQNGEVCLTYFDGFFLSYGFSFVLDLDKLKSLNIRAVALSLDKDDLVKELQAILAK